MTVRPGESWGGTVPRPEGLVTVHGDHSLAEALVRPGSPPVEAGSGDLARTLGVTSYEHRSMANEFPIDLVDVRLDDGPPIVSCAHVIARSPWSRGHWFRGPILAVMNAEFIGDWDVAPRGHPNDGRVEVFEVDPSMSTRHRIAARRRLRSATHVPHPCVRTRSVRSGTWTFERPLEVIVDGRHVGRASSVAGRVLPDAAVLYA
jgi:hypothetical protein